MEQRIKASDGPRRTGLNDHRQFAIDIIDAHGDWVELDMESDNPSNTPRTVLVHIGREFAEVTQRDGTLFGRLRVRNP